MTKTTEHEDTRAPEDGAIPDVAAPGPPCIPDAVLDLGDEWVEFTGADTEQSARDAQASKYLRALGGLTRQRDDRVAALKAEVEHVKSVYTRAIERLDDGIAYVSAIVQTVALASWSVRGFGKGKSRAVGHGTYGVRKSPRKIVVDDSDAVVAVLAEQAPELVTVTLRMRRSDLVSIREWIDDLLVAYIPPSPAMESLQAALCRGEAHADKHDIIEYLARRDAQLHAELPDVLPPLPGVTIVPEDEAVPFAKADAWEVR